MNEKQFKKVVELVESGHKVRMKSGPYIHEFASVWHGDDEWMIENNVLAQRKLINVNFHDLSFYKEVKVDV